MVTHRPSMRPFARFTAMESGVELELVIRLRSSPIFGGLSDDELAWLVREMEPCGARAGELVLRCGDLGDALFWIESGRLVVTPEGAAGATVAELGAGDSFGEMAIIEIAPRSASVHAVTDSVLYRLRARALRRLHQERPEAFTLLVLNLARELSRRLRRANADLLSLRGTSAAHAEPAGEPASANTAVIEGAARE